jgi:hypothetical protein
MTINRTNFPGTNPIFYCYVASLTRRKCVPLYGGTTGTYAAMQPQAERRLFIQLDPGTPTGDGTASVKLD